MKKIKKLLLMLMIGVWASGAIAHSPLKITIPADESTVSLVPSELILEFKDKIRLTKVSVVHVNNPGMDLDLTDFKGFNSTYVIPMHDMGSGDYVINWRGLGADGHALTGYFSFTVK